ncbi:MAG: tRNA (guanosine(37)-N1)-methyltransferase TrmD [Hyphomonadaceae bacterium]|nr:tRNA (guanosine(37)-N1)-methyltransferase TrmD [Hyphomonadaceae bacterium]
MMFAATALTLFPEAFPGTLGLSLLGRGLRDGQWTLDTVNLREFGIGPHKNVDDTPAGGGAGMVFRPDVVAAALDSIGRGGRPIVCLSPRGAPVTQAHVADWAAGPGLVVFCGRFEGVDERVIEARGMQEISVADVVLAGGEAAALVLIEACVRLLPGILGNQASIVEESFSDGLLEHPQYTRPRVWEGREIPDILLSGDHGKVAAWRLEQRLRLTAQRRPDLMAKRRS